MSVEGRIDRSLLRTCTNREDKEMITMEQFAELNGAIKDAQTDDTPFISTTDDEIHVFGNPNKTEIKSADYTVLFAFPDTKEWQRKINATGDRVIKKIDRYVIVERTYKDIYLSPRNAGNAITAITLIESLMNDITEDGEVKPLSYDQMMSVMSSMNNEVSDAVYDLVGAVLRIPYAEQEWMLPLNAMENAVKIVKNNPSAVNEADLFFGSSLGGL